MQYPKTIIKSVSFCAVVLLCVFALNLLLVPWSSLQIKFDAYKSIDGKIETLILGSSLEGHIDRFTISREFDTNTFTFAPQSGYPEVLYYILLNAIRSNKIKRVLVGWDILQNLQTPHYKYPHEEEFYRCFLPYICGNTEICNYIIKGMLNQPYTYSFFEYASFPENVHAIKEVFESKQRRKNNSGTDLFAPKSSAKGREITGAAAENTDEPIDINNIEKPNFNFHKVVDKAYTTKIYDSDKKYVELIKELCAKNGIELLFLYCPSPDIVIQTLPDYYGMVKSTRDMFNELGIKYIDTLDSEYFPGSTNNTNFSDCPGHLIKAYDTVYTKAICRWIKEHH